MICISFLLSLILIFTGGFYMYRLILVEDDYQIRTGLSSFFPWNSTGFQLLASFENGKKALDFLRTHKVDVILTDIKMPVMNGLELAKAIREFSADINVVFLSAYRNFDFAREALEYGVRNYIVKSTRYDDLIEIFSQLKEELDARGNLSPAPSPAAEPRVDNQVIRQIIEAIDNDIANASLQHLADLVQINPVYLSRFFKEKTGMNFSDYILKRKMETAAGLLKNTNSTIYEISEMVGYSNDKNFSRAFKKYFGVSPTTYKHIPE